MRALLRLLGLILLAGAFAALVADATRTVTAGHLEILSLDAMAARVSPDAIPRLRGIGRDGKPAPWSPVLIALLSLPGFVALGLAGLLLLLAGRPPRPVIGHSRR